MTPSTLYKVNLIAILIDIQDQLLCEIEPDLRHGMKQMTTNARIHTRKLIREFDRIHSDKNAEAFGIAADDIRRMIDERYLTEV